MQLELWAHPADQPSVLEQSSVLPLCLQSLPGTAPHCLCWCLCCSTATPLTPLGIKISILLLPRALWLYPLPKAGLSSHSSLFQPWDGSLVSPAPSLCPHFHPCVPSSIPGVPIPTPVSPAPSLCPQPWEGTGACPGVSCDRAQVPVTPGSFPALRARGTAVPACPGVTRAVCVCHTMGGEVPLPQCHPQDTQVAPGVAFGTGGNPREKRLEGGKGSPAEPGCPGEGSSFPPCQG